MSCSRLNINERLILQELKNNASFKKKNGTINISKIAKQMSRSYSAIWEELNRFDDVNEYDAVKAQKTYIKNKK